MAGKHKIRWRESDQQELQRAIKNYNAKIRRLEKNKPDMVDFLPQRVTKKSAMEQIESRADFNRVVSSLQRFTVRGAETPVVSSRGAKATQWEVDEFKHKQRIENARRTRERKKLESQEVKIAGKGQGRTRAEMGSIKENELKPSRKNFKNMSMEEWKKANALMEKRLRASYGSDKKRIMQVNYMRGLIHAGYDESLVNYIATVPFDTFYKIAMTDEAGTIDFIYDPIALKEKQSALWDVWEEHGTGKNVLGITSRDIEYAESKNNVSNEYFLSLLNG